MSFRENLREALDYSDLEQKELAYKANVSLRSIENYLRENGSVPVADKAVQIAQVLGVTVEYLVTGKNSPEEDYRFIDPEILKLVRIIKKLPKNKQHIIIKNALHLAEII
jgi:transcriptional regulator with XRE-family HTH domain